MKTCYLFLVIITIASVSLFALNHNVPADYQTIQAALSASSTGDTVFVAPGIYQENINWPQVDGIVLKSTGSMLNTIIDANHNSRGIGFVGSSSNPVITSATKVDGFTIKNGYSNLNGAGAICYFASPEFYNCIIAYNECTQMGSGGGLYCYGASPHLNNVIIVYNKAYSGGGAHIDPTSSPVFNSCVIADNTLISTGGSYAAGIYGRYEVYFQLNNCTITRNNFNYAAAIHLGEVCIPTIQHSTITDNVYGIMVVHNGGITLQNNNLVNNQYGGLWHYDTDSDVLNAQNNWWGAVSGPFHETLNPLGEGDIILGSVTFSNWLQSPDPTSPLAPPLGVDISNITNTSITINWGNSPEPGFNHYVINYGLDSLAVIHPNNIASSEAEYTLTNLSPNTYYSIQIAAVSNSNVQGWYSKQVTVRTAGGSAIQDMEASAPFISNSYPNPFAGNTRISYNLKQPGLTSLNIYNLKGELVSCLFKGRQAAGASDIIWNGRNSNNEAVGAGIYFARLAQNGKVNTMKLVLLK